MPRGKGVKLQSYREGGLRDGLVFTAADGAAWTDSAGRTRAWPEWRDWLGRRARPASWSPRASRPRSGSGPVPDAAALQFRRARAKRQHFR